MSGQRPNPPPCMAYNAELGNPYGYLPSTPAGVIFSILFGISAIIHLWQTIKCRRLWTLLFVFGAGIECMGWIARTKSHDCPYSVPLFTMQTAVLIMGKSRSRNLDSAHTNSNISSSLDPGRHLRDVMGHYQYYWSRIITSSRKDLSHFVYLH